MLCCLVCLYTRWPSPNCSTAKGGVYQIAFDLSETQFSSRRLVNRPRPAIYRSTKERPERPQGQVQERQSSCGGSSYATNLCRRGSHFFQQQALLPFAAGQQRFTFMPVPKYHERDIRTQMSMLYNFLTRGFDTEDVQYIRQSYELMLGNDTDIKQHSTGSVRTQSFCKIDPREKAKYKYLHLCGTAAGNHLKNNETAKAVTKMQGFREMPNRTSASTELLKFRKNQLKFAKSTIHDDGIDRCRRDAHRVGGPGGPSVGDGSARDQIRSDRHQQHVPVPDRHGYHHRRDQVRQPGPVPQPQLQFQLLHQGHHDRVGEEDCDLLVAADRRQRGDHVRLQGPARGRENISFY
ncbi:histone-lysine N-methyltransferase SETD1A-like [Culex pipiens pallens]|uniref:histone-lysine N-methyltransferase SETD1A-like n=1 Tax=Culex pipiens pallens TaxID=42434 RepID=UPI0022AABD26|nr:histone-lysine N-methyltransferase SETD1A-like [Culex pipiens pallens]